MLRLMETHPAAAVEHAVAVALERHSPRLETVRLILRQQQAGPPAVCRAVVAAALSVRRARATPPFTNRTSRASRSTARSAAPERPRVAPASIASAPARRVPGSASQPSLGPLPRTRDAPRGQTCQRPTGCADVGKTARPLWPSEKS